MANAENKIIIRSEEEYQAVMRRIDEVFDAKPGSPEAELLAALVDDVEAYEEQHYPDQDWFWTETWQKGEREAESDFQTGTYESFSDMEAFIASLDDPGID